MISGITSSGLLGSLVEMQSEIGGRVHTEGSGGMASNPLKYRLSHLIVRSVATVNIAHLLLSHYPPYFRATLSIFGLSDINWMTASALLLPLYVGFETWWMFGVKPSQKKPLLIDWAFASTWFVMWCGTLLYSFYLFFPPPG